MWSFPWLLLQSGAQNVEVLAGCPQQVPWGQFVELVGGKDTKKGLKSEEHHEGYPLVV